MAANPSGQLAQPFGYRAQPLAVIALVVVLSLGFFVGLSFLLNRFHLPVAITAALCVALSILCLVRMQWVLYVLVLACLFSPQLVLTEALGPTAKRPVTLRVEDVILGVIAISWLARTAVHKELGLLMRTPLNKPILFYTLVCVVATALGFIYGWVTDTLGASLFVLKYIEYFVLFFMVVNHVETSRDTRNLVIASLLTYLLVCLYGLAQVPQGERPSAPWELMTGEPNTLAGYLVLLVGVCAGLFFYVRSILHKVLCALLCTLGAVLLAFTLSRSGWLGLFGILVVFLFVGRHRLAMLTALTVVFAVLVASAFRTDWLPEKIAQRIDETAGKFEPLYWAPPVVILGQPLDPSASERYRSFEAALKTWVDRSNTHWIPTLTGSGVLGGSPYVDGQYIRIISETGLLGLAAFLLLIGVIARHAWRAYRTLEIPWHRGFALGYLAGFVGLLFHAIGANSFIIVRIMEPFFIFTAIVIHLPALERDERARAAPGQPKP